MKKLLLLSLIGFYSLISTTIQAQDAKELAKETALEVCDCIEPILQELHPALTDYMRDVVELGEETAQESLTEYLMANQDEMEAIMADASMLQGMDSNGDMTTCFSKIEESISQMDIDAGISKEEFETEMYRALENEPDCELTNLLLIIGERSN